MHLGQPREQQGVQGALPRSAPALPHSPGSAPARSCRSRGSFRSPRPCTPPPGTSPRPGPAGGDTAGHGLCAWGPPLLRAPHKPEGSLPHKPGGPCPSHPPPPPQCPRPTSRRRKPCTVMMTKPWTELKTAKRTWKRMERRSVMASTADIQVSASRGRTTQELHSDALGQGERAGGEPTTGASPAQPRDPPLTPREPTRAWHRARCPKSPLAPSVPPLLLRIPVPALAGCWRHCPRWGGGHGGSACPHPAHPDPQWCWGAVG